MMRHSDAATTLKHYQKILEPSVVKGVYHWYLDLTEAPERKGPGREELLPSKQIQTGELMPFVAVSLAAIGLEVVGYF
jgi:hypothetical protein